MKIVALTVIGGIHLISQRKPVCSFKSGTIFGWMEHWLIKQVRKVASNKTLVCTIRVLSTSLQLVKHIPENLH